MWHIWQFRGTNLTLLFPCVIVVIRRSSHTSGVSMRESEVAPPLREGSSRERRAARGTVLIWVMGLFLASCSDLPPTAGPTFNESMLTPAAQALMDADGRFRRADVPARAFKQLGYRRAEELADAYVATFGSLAEGDWSRHHEGRVEAAALRACGRAEYAQSAYEAIGPEASATFRNYFEGQYIVQYCGSAGVPQVLVSISSVDAGLTILSDGRLMFPAQGSAGSVHAQGIPPNAGGAAVVTPERAVAIAAEKTGRRVAGAPELVMPPFPMHSAFARWRVPLETSVRGRASDDEQWRDVEYVWVGQELGILRPIDALIPSSDPSASSRDLEIPQPGPTAGSVLMVRVRLTAAAPRRLSVWTPIVEVR